MWSSLSSVRMGLDEPYIFSLWCNLSVNPSTHTRHTYTVPLLTVRSFTQMIKRITRGKRPDPFGRPREPRNTWERGNKTVSVSLQCFDCCEAEGAGAHPRESQAVGERERGRGERETPGRGGRREDKETRRGRREAKEGTGTPRGRRRKKSLVLLSSSPQQTGTKFTDSLWSRWIIWINNDHSSAGGECQGSVG